MTQAHQLSNPIQRGHQGRRRHLLLGIVAHVHDLYNRPQPAGERWEGGGFLRNYSSKPTLTDCIQWADSPQKLQVDCGDPDIAYSKIQGYWSGVDNISADPVFVSAPRCDYRLTAASPDVDSGTYEGALNSDVEHDNRPPGDGLDMGADEYVDGQLFGLQLSLSGYEASYSPGNRADFTINIANPDGENHVFTGAVLWSKSPTYEPAIQEGRAVVLKGENPFSYRFRMRIPNRAPLGDYTVGITIFRWRSVALRRFVSVRDEVGRRGEGGAPTG